MNRHMRALVARAKNCFGWAWNAVQGAAGYTKQGENVIDTHGVCRICLDEDAVCASYESALAKDGVFSACDCRGTLQYMHATCADKWIQTSMKSTCEICKKRFRANITTTHNTFRAINLVIYLLRNACIGVVWLTHAVCIAYVLRYMAANAVLFVPCMVSMCVLFMIDEYDLRRG